MLVFEAGTVVESHGPEKVSLLDNVVGFGLNHFWIQQPVTQCTHSADDPKQASPALIFNEAKPCQVRDLGRDGPDFQGFVGYKSEKNRCYYWVGGLPV